MTLVPTQLLTNASCGRSPAVTTVPAHTSAIPSAPARRRDASTTDPPERRLTLFTEANDAPAVKARDFVGWQCGILQIRGRSYETAISCPPLYGGDVCCFA